MAEIHHLIGVKASPAKAFAAVATAKGIAGWWSKTVRGEVAKGKTFDVVFDTARVRLEAVALQKNKKVTWQATKDDYGMAGTRVSFDISRKKNETIVHMTHTGFKKMSEFDFAFLSTKWAVFMFSLKDYIEKGKGRPFPKDPHVMHQDF